MAALTALLEVVSDGFGFSKKLTTFPISSISKIPLLPVSMVTRERISREMETELGRERGGRYHDQDRYSRE